NRLMSWQYRGNARGASQGLAVNATNEPRATLTLPQVSAAAGLQSPVSRLLLLTSIAERQAHHARVQCLNCPVTRGILTTGSHLPHQYKILGSVVPWLHLNRDMTPVVVGHLRLAAPPSNHRALT